jgi:hypothetical protein
VLEVIFVVVLFQGSKAGTAVILRAATALLVTEMLPGVRSEEALGCD